MTFAENLIIVYLYRKKYDISIQDIDDDNITRRLRGGPSGDIGGHPTHG